MAGTNPSLIQAAILFSALASRNGRTSELRQLQDQILALGALTLLHDTNVEVIDGQRSLQLCSELCQNLTESLESLPSDREAVNIIFRNARRGLSTLLTTYMLGWTRWLW